MGFSGDCRRNTDPLKLVREGTSQDQRLPPALDSLKKEFPLIDEHTAAHRMVFAQAYAAYLKFYDAKNKEDGNWQDFFGSDVSVLLAIAAVQDVDYYKPKIKEYFDYLKDIDDKSDVEKSKNYLGYLFSCAGTLALRLDILKEGLPTENHLKDVLQTVVQGQLAPLYKKLVLCYREGLHPVPPPDPPYHNDVAPGDIDPSFVVMGTAPCTFKKILEHQFSKVWIAEEGVTEWSVYLGHLLDPSHEQTGMYGSGNAVWKRIQHIATHNLFTSIFDQFLKAYARIVIEANRALEETFTKWDRHEPHYALFLAFLRLLEYARKESNTLTVRHLDFYYREILRLKEKGTRPGKAHLLIELAKQAPPHLLKAGEMLKAGKDDLGKDAFFSNDRDFVANHAKVTALKTIYLHKNKPEEILDFEEGRLFASPVADSDDGLGADLTSLDQSWHPFNNKEFKDGKLSKIRMPKAEVGFAIASHYLLMSEGKRTVTVEFAFAKSIDFPDGDYKDDVVISFTTEKGWFEIEKTATQLTKEMGNLKLTINLDGADPPVISYSEKIHKYNFTTNLPILLVRLRHRSDSKYIYSRLQDVVVDKIHLTVDVTGLKTLAVSNDFGPVDTSKLFQPFGAQPVNGANFIVGSKEVFQKSLNSASIVFDWQNSQKPTYYISTTPGIISTEPKVKVSYLISGQWSIPTGNINLDTSEYNLGTGANVTLIQSPDLSENEPYSLASRNGYVRLILSGDLNFKQYQVDFTNYLAKIDPKPTTHPGASIQAPVANAVWMNYKSSQDIFLNSSQKEYYEKRPAIFYHIAPFGQAEQHPFLSSTQKVYLLPQFDFRREGVTKKGEAEFHIGITGLKPPQNLALLFQVADGTANPLSEKPPKPHLHWSYLRGNEWIPFEKNDVDDGTGDLLNSGITTFAVPRDASGINTLLAAGMHWIRAAVSDHSDAVCRLRKVAAQAVSVTFADKGNEPAFSAKVLAPGTINKLDQPDSAIKAISQPYPTFGGRGKEAAPAFHTRISERLRHKDRAIALWDFERLILEAFPQIHKVKCLNHTQYEPDESGMGTYWELAPGHVTIVTIPNQEHQDLRDPLRPYTSLGLLGEIESFLRQRLSCFVNVHVKNPVFEEVQVRCNVRLKDAPDDTFYVNELKEAIKRFLSPWAFPGGGSPTFGGKILKSVLIDFVEDQRYVDYVTDFRLLHQDADKNEIEGTTAVSILVSAREHEIVSIHPPGDKTAGEKCRCEA